MIAVVGEHRSDGKSSFRDLISYIAASDNAEKTLYTNSRGFDFKLNSAAEIAKEMEYTAALNKRVKDAVFHGILSFREGEEPSAEQIDEAVNIYLAEMGLEGCQCFYGAHRNTQNLHIHLCVNRVDPVSLKAIDPAGGLWKKADERAARRIELAQGWEIERSGVFYEVVDGEIYERTSKRRIKPLSGKAKDFENAASAKSAERIARERCAAILFGAQSWQEVHESLAEKGCRIERKGSGAVLLVGEIPVKLSRVSQSLSLKKMESRLGAFEAASREVSAQHENESSPSCAEPMTEETANRRYLGERSAFYKARQDARRALNSLFDKERKELREKHRRERKELFESRASWRGAGAELNALRSILAWRQMTEREEWEKSKQVRRKELRKQQKQTFPSYKEWLAANEDERSAMRWRYRSSAAGTISGNGGADESSRAPLKYRTCIKERWDGGLSALLYYDGSKDEAEQAQFADLGKRIDVMNWRNEETLKDALKLAAQKWGGGLTVNGSDCYKALCVRVAVENGIALSNPELQEMIRIEKEEQAKRSANDRHIWGARMRGLGAAFKAYDEAIGAERYRVTAMYEGNDGKRRAFILDKEPGMESVGFTKEEIEERMSEIDVLDRKGRNLYYTPISGDMHHILVDDLTKEKLELLLKDGYSPAVILESSPGNYQAVLNVPKLHCGFDRETANRLMRELNEKYGDPKIRAAVHPHRIPGTHNNKAKHRRPDGTFPEVKLISARKQICAKALERSRSLAKAIEKEIKEAEAAKRNAMYKLRENDRRSLSPYEAYMCHAEDLIAHYGSISDWSSLDAMIAVRMYVTGYSEAERADAIAQGAKDIRPLSEQGKHHWPSYGARTAKSPETPAGQSEARKIEHKRNAWLSLERRYDGGRKQTEESASRMHR